MFKVGGCYCEVKCLLIIIWICQQFVNQAVYKVVVIIYVVYDICNLVSWCFEEGFFIVQYIRLGIVGGVNRVLQGNNCFFVLWEMFYQLLVN